MTTPLVFVWCHRRPTSAQTTRWVSNYEAFQWRQNISFGRSKISRWSNWPNYSATQMSLKLLAIASNTFALPRATSMQTRKHLGNPVATGDYWISSSFKQSSKPLLNWIMKDHESVEFFTNFQNVKPPPCTNAKTSLWRLSGDSSASQSRS